MTARTEELVDAHCHIDMYHDPHAAALQAERLAIKTVAVTNLPSHFQIGMQHLRAFRWVRLGLGLHPLMARSHSHEYEGFRQLLNRTAYVGEVGLDFSSAGRDTRTTQLESFRFVLECVSGRQLFISVHTRSAEEDALALLRHYRISPVVLHWFTGSATLATEAIEAGHYFSINPAMLSGKRSLDIIRAIPRERILTESDGPYCLIRERPAHPSDMRLVLALLADAWNVDAGEAARQVSENFKTLTAFI